MAKYISIPIILEVSWFVETKSTFDHINFSGNIYGVPNYGRTGEKDPGNQSTGRT